VFKNADQKVIHRLFTFPPGTLLGGRGGWTTRNSCRWSRGGSAGSGTRARGGWLLFL